MRKSSTGSSLILLALLAGCGHASTTKNNSKSSSGTSNDSGKVYTSDSKGPQSGSGKQGPPAAGGQTGSGSSAPLPSPADTINSKASPASDAGLASATRGQVVMTPGAPTAPVTHAPGKH